MNFLTPLALLGGLLAIPIILLYMLRLRRREVMISSTFLWRQVLQDQEANTPWQRLRRNLLLFLQLIILALLVLALMRPFITVPAVSAGQVTVLLDASASMNAADMDGDTRFQAAQDEAINIVDTLGDGNRMTVIRVAGVPEVVISSSDNHNALRDAIRDTAPGLGEADWDAALNLAAAGSAGAEDFTMVIIGDGGLPETAGLPGINGELRYIPVGQVGDNVAITALATRALPGGDPQLYAQITNYGDTEARVVFTLFVDDQRFAASNETIPPRGNLPIISSALPENFQLLRAMLTQSVNAEAPDYLALDDEAYAVYNSGSTRRVLVVTQGNIFLEQVLRSLPGLETVRTDGESGLPDNYDIYVFDSFIPAQMPPESDLLFINPPRGVPGLFGLGEESSATGSPRVVDRSDPRMAFVEVDQLSLLRFRPVVNADWADSLIDADGGSLLLAGENDDRQVAIMPFNLRESDLPLQISWPVLVANLMEWFTPRQIITVRDSVNVGESLAINPPFEVDAVRVTLPGGEVRNLPVEREIVVFAETQSPGIYNVALLNNGETVNEQAFAVNLFSTLESNIAPVPLDGFTVEGTVLTVDEQEELGQREFWPLVALLALLVLMIEWYAYHQRLRVPTMFRRA